MENFKSIVHIKEEKIEFETYIWHDGPKLEISDKYTLIWYDASGMSETWFLIPKPSDDLVESKISMRDFILKNETFICKRIADSDFDTLLNIEKIKDFSIYTLPEEGVYLNS